MSWAARASARLAELPREARLLLVGVSVNALGMGLSLPLLVVYLHDVRGLPLDVVGVLAGTPALVSLVLLAPIGVLIDRLGPRRVQAVALACSSAGIALLSVAQAGAVALVAMMLLGVGTAAFWPASQAPARHWSPRWCRRRYGRATSACRSRCSTPVSASAAW
jgi:MFS family permease